LGELMNRLAQYRNGVLVSRQILKAANLLEGQRLPLEITVGGQTQKLEVVIVGVYDYFPTVFPKQQETVICNLSFLFDQTGDPSVYNVWLKTAPGTQGDAIEQAILEMRILPMNVGDAPGTIGKQIERVEWIGIFGVLTIGFLAGSILSWLGLLVYTSASMQGRMQQIGVLKAIGVQTNEALLMEGVEYAGVILYGILGGVLAGAIVSFLFVPFFQFNVTAATALPPFIPLVDWASIRWFAVAFATALILSEGAILYQATRKDIFQALRMGQRE